jgi:hypothetical protein
VVIGGGGRWADGGRARQPHEQAAGAEEDRARSAIRWWRRCSTEPRSRAVRSQAPRPPARPTPWAKLDRYGEVVEHGQRRSSPSAGRSRGSSGRWCTRCSSSAATPRRSSTSTVIIEDNPFDSDFWWWRGEDLVRSKQHAAALADYRQSFANAQRPEAARFPAGRILDAADPAGRPCEGVFALRYFVEVQGGDLSGSLERRAAGLAASAGCDDKAGRGTATWSPSADDATIRVDVTSGAATGRFIVDARTGTTAVSQDFARPGRPGGWRSGGRHGRRQRSQGRHPDRPRRSRSGRPRPTTSTCWWSTRCRPASTASSGCRTCGGSRGSSSATRSRSARSSRSASRPRTGVGRGRRAPHGKKSFRPVARSTAHERRPGPGRLLHLPRLRGGLPGRAAVSDVRRRPGRRPGHRRGDRGVRGRAGDVSPASSRGRGRGPG